jgi:hypothetical protein
MPVTPVVSGKPVQLVSVPDAGVPSIGVTRVGEVESTTPPEPVEAAVTPVPPLSTGRTPVTLLRGRPVQFVSVPDVGVPNAGETRVGEERIGEERVGEVASTFAPEPVEVVAPVPPFVTVRIPVTPVVRGKPIQFVSVPDIGVPNIGVTRVGDVERTFAPVPVEVEAPVPPLTTSITPERSEVGIVELVDSAPVPVPFTYPVIVERPVPPLDTGRTPLTVVVRLTLP